MNDSAKIAGVDGSSASIVKWLTRISSEWLLVLDNADGDLKLLQQYLPKSTFGKLLISSRHQDYRSLLKPGCSQEVGNLNREDAKSLLSMIAELDEESIVTKDEKIGSIVDLLRCLPLAVNHAGSAILHGLCYLDGTSGYGFMFKNHFNRLMANEQFQGS